MNPTSILILGGGGHSKVVIETALASCKYQNISILDDQHNNTSPIQNKVLNHFIVGKFKKVLSEEFKNTYDHAFVALGDSEKRLHWLNILKLNNYKIPSLIHPQSYISPSAKIGEGVLVAANAAIQSSVHLKDGVIINTGATIDHDCHIDKGVHICPGVNLAGNVFIGSKSWIGIGSCVIENITIGNNVLVGAGSSVLKDLPNNVKAFGSPAKLSKKIN